MKTKEMVVERKWEYSSTLYLAILYECVARQDYAMANMVVEVRKIRWKSYDGRSKGFVGSTKAVHCEIA